MKPKFCTTVIKDIGEDGHTTMMKVIVRYNHTEFGRAEAALIGDLIDEYVLTKELMHTATLKAEANFYELMAQAKKEEILKEFSES